MIIEHMAHSYLMPIAYTHQYKAISLYSPARQFLVYAVLMNNCLRDKFIHIVHILNDQCYLCTLSEKSLGVNNYSFAVLT